MGYDVELLKGTKADVERSPVIRAKKQKKCEKSGDEDWSYLISSKHHEVCLNQTGNILGLGQATETDIQADFDVSCGQLTFSRTFLLFLRYIMVLIA